jgi:hypothetical protein
VSLWCLLRRCISCQGTGQEEFGAIELSRFGTFLVMVPVNAVVHIDNGYAPENYKTMLAQEPGNPVTEGREQMASRPIAAAFPT